MRRRLFEYASSLAALAAALLLRGALAPVLGARIPFATLLGAVAVAVGVGGIPPAVMVTVLGYVAGRLLFFDPRGSLAFANPAEWMTLAGYLFACGTIILFGTVMRRANERERAAAAALADLNQRKDRLLATVAHELRNPLEPIRTAAELLRRGVGTATPTDDFASGMIDRQIDHLTRLIDDLVDIDRIARNELELRLERQSLTALLEQAVASTRPTIEARKQRLVATLDPNPLELQGDGHRLQQVFVNLLLNASKFSAHDGRIEVLSEREGSVAILSVRDNGRGVSPEALPHLFETFYQADRNSRGLGLGLAIVHRLVVLHGGTVTAQSAGLGRGSEFRIRLPLAPYQPPFDPPVRRPPAVAAVAGGVPLEGRGMA
jgi:signal transduction histidine kinase